jgi:hypothetical protein
MPPGGSVGTASSDTFATSSAAWISGSSWKRCALSRVEVAHAVVAGALQELDEVEGVADALGSEPEVLVVLAGSLRVEVDVEELPVPERLRDRMMKRQARHGLVRELGVHADHVRYSSSSMNASMCPTVGSRMSPRGSFGLGSSANRNWYPRLIAYSHARLIASA